MFTVVGAGVVAQAAGFDVAIYTTDLGSPPRWRRRRVEGVGDLPPRAAELDLRVFGCSRFSRIAYSHSILQALWDAVPAANLVRIHSLWMFPSYAAAKVARSSGVPYVVSLHGALNPYFRGRGRIRKSVVSAAWQNRMLEDAAALHLATPREAELTGDFAANTPRIICPNGIWFEEFNRLPDPVESKASVIGAARAERLVIAFIGRLAREKAVDRLLIAYAILPEHIRRRTHLIVAGPDDQDQEATLRRLAQDLAIAGDVTFKGMLAAAERRMLLAASDVFVLPSHTENFGIAALEAMAAGLAVVVSPGVNLAPDIERRGAGLVAANEPSVLAGALRELLENEPLRKNVAENGRRMAQEYDWHSIGPVVENAFAKRATVQPPGSL